MRLRLAGAAMQLDAVARELACRASGVIRELRRRRSGGCYQCRVLQGRSEYNLCVNCDMTVSCNCNDVDGAGILGDLRRDSLESILDGDTAAHFRKRLAQGNFAIPRCRVCPELVVCAEPAMRFEGCPAGIMVENTSRCTLQCRSCQRATLEQTRSRTLMSAEDMARVSCTVQRLGIQRVFFYNLGEPFLSPNVRRELETLRRDNPALWIGVSTNGLPLDSDEKRDAALLANDLCISLDGIDTAMVRRYQCRGDFDRAYANLRSLAERKRRTGAGTQVGWRYVVFRWNDRRPVLVRAIDLAREAGADYIEFVHARTPFRGISWRWSLFYRRAVIEHGGQRAKRVWLAQ